MPSTKLVEKRKEFEAKQNKLLKIYDEAGDGYDFEKCSELQGTTEERREQYKKLNLELADVRKEVDSLVQLENEEKALREGMKDRETPAMFSGKQEGEAKTIGKLFVESRAYKDRKSGRPEATVDIDMKTTFSRSAGYAPESIRSGLIVPYAARPVQIIDTIPGGTINQATYKYMEETTQTNNAAEISEAGAYGESAFALTERSQTVEKIGHSLPVTDEQLEDVEGIESYLDAKMLFCLKQRADYQIMNGDGSTPNLQGMLEKTGIQSIVHSGDHFDTIARAIKLVRTVGFAMPNVIYINSADWWSTKLRLSKADDGYYKLGPPTEAGPVVLWGIKVVENAVIPEGTVLVADTNGFAMLLEKRGITFKITDSHASEYVSGVQRIRADVRMVMVITRALAFCEVTGV